MVEVSKDKVSFVMLGAGVVGASVLRHFFTEKSRLEELCGCNLDLRRVLVRDLFRDRDVSVPQSILCTDVDDVLNDPSVRLVVSLMGGEDAEKKYILRSLRNGQSVVTANKLVVAKYGPDG